MKCKTILILLLTAAGLAQADLRFAAIFSDHQVLQREMNVPVWGFGATPGETVTVTFGGQVKTTTAESNGWWRVELDPMSANTNSQDLAVSCDGESVTLTDILVGEVWMCGGQSNMNRSFQIDISGGYDQREADRLLADYPQIRFRKLLIDLYSSPLDDLRRGPYMVASTAANEFWQPYTPDTAYDSSSLPYYFAKKLYEELDVPVGVIQHSISGSGSYTWVREDVLVSIVGSNELQDAYADSDLVIQGLGYADWDAVEAHQEAWMADPNRSAPYPPGTGGGGAHNRPTTAFNAMINPIAGVALRGMIWHRGEAPQGYDLHAEIYQGMIGLYRQLWSNDFHVIAGSLINVNDPDGGVPDLDPLTINVEYLMNRRDYENLGREISGFDFISFQDLGNYWRDDISQAVKDANGVHYEAKDVAGARMAVTALSTVYGDPNPDYETPIFSRAFLDDQNRARIRLDNTGSGLTLNTNNFMGDNKGFVIEAPGGTLYYADVELDGDQLLVWHASVPNPASVSYCWHNNPKTTLYNNDGLPALFFQATNFPALLAGDANLDATVDNDDYALLSANWGSTDAHWGDGDFDGDGDVDNDDLAVLNDAIGHSILVSPLSLTVPEGGATNFSVRLSLQPSSAVTVAVARASGDTGINVQSGDESLTFTTNNWDIPQDVTLEAAEDADWIAGSATIRCSSGGYTDVDLLATEADNDEDPTRHLPFAENFEERTEGDLNGQYGWVAGSGAQVQSSTARDTQALALNDATASHTFDDAPTNVWITLWMQPVTSEITPDVDADALAAFYVNTNNLLVVYDSTNATEITEVGVSNGWNKIEVFCDFISKHWNISLNGTEAATNLGFYADASAFSGLVLSEGSTNSAFYDDIAITDSQDESDTDGDGLPDSWEQQHYGSTAVAPTNAAANGINTVRQAYIAGLNPTNPAAKFLISDLRPLTAESILGWNATSGRVYSVYWTSNLLSSFQCLESNLTGGAFTDAVHGAANEGFYKIEVELEQ